MYLAWTIDIGKRREAANLLKKRIALRLLRKLKPISVAQVSAAEAFLAARDVTDRAAGAPAVPSPVGFFQAPRCRLALETTRFLEAPRVPLALLSGNHAGPVNLKIPVKVENCGTIDRHEENISYALRSHA